MITLASVLLLGGLMDLQELSTIPEISSEQSGDKVADTVATMTSGGGDGSSLAKTTPQLSSDDRSGSDISDARSPATTTQEVPEFPTIAIPMAAIIGMTFFFSRKQ
nr:PEF-CTERM sorting domain-containing protein [uncultured Methanolobus sp.]